MGMLFLINNWEKVILLCRVSLVPLVYAFPPSYMPRALSLGVSPREVHARGWPRAMGVGFPSDSWRFLSCPMVTPGSSGTVLSSSSQPVLEIRQSLCSHSYEKGHSQPTSG